MANKLKELLNQPLPQDNSTRGTLLVVIGGYLIYMAYEMVQNTLTGKSTMSMTMTVVFAGIMALAGLAIIVYCVHMWRVSRQKGDDSLQLAAEEEPE